MYILLFSLVLGICCIITTDNSFVKYIIILILYLLAIILDILRRTYRPWR